MTLHYQREWGEAQWPQRRRGARRWGGTGIFAYVADAPLGPYALHGDINNAAGVDEGRTVASLAGRSFSLGI